MLEHEEMIFSKRTEIMALEDHDIPELAKQMLQWRVVYYDNLPRGNRTDTPRRLHIDVRNFLRTMDWFEFLPPYEQRDLPRLIADHILKERENKRMNTRLKKRECEEKKKKRDELKEAQGELKL